MWRVTITAGIGVCIGLVVMLRALRDGPSLFQFWQVLLGFLLFPVLFFGVPLYELVQFQLLWPNASFKFDYLWPIVAGCVSTALVVWSTTFPGCTPSKGGLLYALFKVVRATIFVPLAGGYAALGLIVVAWCLFWLLVSIVIMPFSFVWAAMANKPEVTTALFRRWKTDLIPLWQSYLRPYRPLHRWLCVGFEPQPTSRPPFEWS